jgi:predicted DNA-binding ribbon-helix-helix protein
MQSTIVKRSIIISAHKTSVSLEDAFWQGLKQIARSRGVTLSELAGTIDEQRRAGNLSSAIRLFVLGHFQAGHSDGASAAEASPHIATELPHHEVA